MTDTPAGGQPGAQPGAAAAPGASGAPATPWYEGKADANMVSFLSTKGYDKLDAPTAALTIAKSYAEAEKYIGAPPDQIIRLPKAGDVDAAKQFWQRLGVPTEAKDYDLGELKHADGTATEQKFTDWVRTTALKLNITKDAAKALAGELVKLQDDTHKGELAILQDGLNKEKEKLAKNWGTNAPINLLAAQKGAAKLGVSPEAVAALEKQVGYADVMEMFRKVGALTGEAPFTIGLAPGSDNPAGGIMSYDQAVATLTQRKQDSAWVGRYINGGTDERREMDALNRIIASGKAA